MKDSMKSFEKMPPPERKSSFQKIVGVSKFVEKIAKDTYAGKFSEQKSPELKKMGIKEIEKTPKQIEVIKYVNELAKEICKKYGGQEIEISKNKVHILKGNDYEEFTKKKIRALNMRIIFNLFL